MFDSLGRGRVRMLNVHARRLAGIVMLALALNGCRSSHDAPASKGSGGEASMTKAASPVESIVQLVIDLPQLQAFLHPELADRKPLVLIESKEVSPDLSLKKFGQPVSIVQLNAAKGKP